MLAALRCVIHRGLLLEARRSTEVMTVLLCFMMVESLLLVGVGPARRILPTFDPGFEVDRCDRVRAHDGPSRRRSVAFAAGATLVRPGADYRRGLRRSSGSRYRRATAASPAGRVPRVRGGVRPMGGCGGAAHFGGINGRQPSSNVGWGSATSRQERRVELVQVLLTPDFFPANVQACALLLPPRPPRLPP